LHNTWVALHCQEGIIQHTPKKRRSLIHSPVRWSGLHLSKLIPLIPLSNARQAAFLSLSHKTNDHPKYKINNLPLPNITLFPYLSTLLPESAQSTEVSSWNPPNREIQHKTYTNEALFCHSPQRRYPARARAPTTVRSSRESCTIDCP
jgi:hypothetical protein